MWNHSSFFLMGENKSLRLTHYSGNENMSLTSQYGLTAIIHKMKNMAFHVAVVVFMLSF